MNDEDRAATRDILEEMSDAMLFQLYFGTLGSSRSVDMFYVSYLSFDNQQAVSSLPNAKTFRREYPDTFIEHGATWCIPLDAHFCGE